MCDNILKAILTCKIDLDSLFNWLGNAKTKDTIKWRCDRITFIHLFLNYIHDGTLSYEINDSGKEKLTPDSPVHSVFEAHSNFVSPLHRPKKSVSPKTPSNVCLGDYLTTRNSKKKVQRNLNENAFHSVKRIHPTNVTQKCVDSHKTNKNSFDFNEVKVPKDFSGAGYLVEEHVEVESHESTSHNLPISGSTTKVVTPSVDLVSFREQLKILARVYSFLLDKCLVINVSSEMFFIITLLLSKGSNESSNSTNHLLRTVHNRVYFAVCVLSLQPDFYHILDKCTIKLLLDNNRFRKFADNKILIKIKEILESKNEANVDVATNERDSVYFVYDTDNRNNFPSYPSFRSFRKQRDMFYDILQQWENWHLTHNWSFEKALGNTIRALINMHWEPCNFIHFSKLFKAQLLTSLCKESAEGNTQLVAISSITNIDTDKLYRLNNRMIGKQTCTGLNSAPTFIGYEEFFKDFILIANSYVFNKHLMDALIAEIVRLDDFTLDIEVFDTNNRSVQNLYLSRLKELRILAKFLGFLEAIPYRTEYKNLPQDVVECQVLIRNQVRPSLNLKRIVLNAVHKKTLTLAIPWVTKYLAMLDTISFKLNHLNELVQLLFQIYYNARPGSIIVKLTLGWLFELSHFPTDLYYEWLFRGTDSRLPKPESLDFYLDEFDIFDHNVSYICCPYLNEIKKILLTDANESNPAISFKHITPITSDKSTSVVVSNRTQKLLQESFFKSQPDSVRKTVEFISERVASACVKEICYNMVPARKQTSVTLLKNDYVPRDDLKSFIKTLASESFKNLTNDIDTIITDMAKMRVRSAVDSLLETALLEETKEVCVGVATRTCLDCVQNWVRTHVQEDIFINNLEAEVKKCNLEENCTKSKAIFNLPIFGKSRSHNSDALSGVDLMKKLRDCSSKIVTNSEFVTASDVIQLIRSIQKSLDERCDINDCVLLAINRMLLDCLLLMISSIPQMVTEILLVDGCSVFRYVSKIDDIFETLFSPRNDLFLSKSPDIALSRKWFGTFVKILTENQLVTVQSIRKQINLVDQDLPCFKDMLRPRIDDTLFSY